MPERTAALWERTPLRESVWLSRATDYRVAAKWEALQPAGSFKQRGIGALCAALVEEGAERLVSSSGGNAGLAAAWAARTLGVPLAVVVPRSTPDFMVERIRACGARVEIHGAVWDEAHQRACALSAAGAGLVHPFDDPRIWAGHASMIGELPERPEGVVLSVGGGGLFCGVVDGLAARGWGDVPVLAVETEGADALSASLEAGALVTLPGITSVAKSLGACTVARGAFERAQRETVRCQRVSDDAALMACRDWLAEERVLVEPACGAAIAGLTAAAADGWLRPGARVVLILCGGAVVRPEHLFG